MRKAEVAVTELSGDIKAADVVLQGDLIIQNADELKAKLLNAQSQYLVLNVILKNVTRLDVAGIQLLVSLKKSPVTKVDFRIEDNDEFNKWFELAGLKQEFFKQ